ncbi:MAG: anti-sigma factor [Actinomycetota bacterium]|nr:anti-sigma factor [Actinomycetota bacterium]
MATFDQLSAEQRAILELLLKQEKTYEGLGELLGMPVARVRELARQSLVTLSPVSAATVDEEWRGQIADYLLQQQSGPEATATRGHLRRSEGARAWSRSVLDSLDQFYDPANLPTIPDGDGAAPPAPRPSWRAELREKLPSWDGPRGDQGKERKELSPAAKALVQRRKIVAGAATLGVVALLATLVWPLGLATGGGDDKEKPRQARRPAPRVVGQLVLEPVEGARGTGVAVIAARGNQRELIVQARLRATRTNQAYEVWLYNSDRDARSVGAQVTDPQGRFQGAGPLPKEVNRYRFIDISSEPVDRNARHSGRSVLRGRISQFQAPVPGAQGQGDQGTAPDAQTPP